MFQAAVDGAKRRVDPQVIERLENGGAATEKLKWGELTEHQREAARVLGYHPQSWDYKEPVPLDDMQWSFLTEEQQRAATLLGWDEKMWNEN